MRRSVLIYNPSAGSFRAADRLDRVLVILRQGGFSVEAVATRCPEDATRLAREAVSDQADVVFALGGDGTVREAAAGLLGTHVELGVLPGGTTNVLSRALGLPRDPESAAQALCTMQSRPMDVGLCGDSPFLMMASVGLDAEVMSDLNHDLKGQFGTLGIFMQGVRHWMSYDFTQVELTADGTPHRATLALVQNIPYYGGPFRMAPSARFDDGRLDCVLYHGHGRPAMLAFVMDVMMDSHHHRSDVEIFPVSEVLFKGPPSLSMQIDGDGRGRVLPASVRLAPERVRVLARPGYCL